MSIPGRVEAAVKGMVLGAGVGVVAFSVALVGLGFLIDGFYLWIQRFVPPDGSAAITGGALLLLAVLTILIGRAILTRIKRRQPTMMQEIRGLAGIAGSLGRLAGLIIRRDPRKSLIVAVIVGAVADYITSGNKKSS